MKIDSRLSETSRGILFLIISVGCFALVDGFSKVVIGPYSFGQVMLARYALAFPALLLAIGPARWNRVFQTRMAGLQIARGLTPAIIGGLMVVAVHNLPLADATVILFAGPFFVVALSGWMLGERVNASSWFGVGVGFLAVLIVARPGFEAFSVYAVLPALGALFYALLQLFTRKLGTAGEDPTTTLAWTLLIGTVVAIPLAALDWRPPDLHAWLAFFGIGASFGIAQYYLAKAFVLAPANILTPFTYFQILAAVIFGIAVFGDVPDFWTMVGTVLILAAGAYVFGRNAVKRT
ncbi:MAG: DMT family transporter [Alphaproteobacteria bacterium]|nr:DMT family transporter [Alphaproteobacteria bacterium]